MAEKRKSIIDEALLESEQIEKAFEANAKEILNHTMGSEIEALVKESLKDSKIGLTEEDDDDEEDVDFDLDFDMEDMDDENEDSINANGTGDDLELDDIDLDLGSEEDDNDEDVDIVDLTGEEDDNEIIRVFKLMSPEDEIEVVHDGGNINIKDSGTGAEYQIQLNGGSEVEDFDDESEYEEDDMNLDLDMDDDSEYEEDELGEGVIYEIVIDDEDGEEDDEMEDEEPVEENTTHTKANLRKRNLKPANLKNESITPRVSQVINENKVLKHKVSSIITENEQLKADYNKMVDALKEFRNKLNEVAVFNSNLTYSVRLFTENTTTKDEKLEIIKRFDEVKTLKESKNTYRQLVKEITNKEPIKESIDVKINQTKTSGSSTKINESKVYVNPELEKMKKLWDYNYKK